MTLQNSRGQNRDLLYYILVATAKRTLMWCNERNVQRSPTRDVALAGIARSTAQTIGGYRPLSNRDMACVRSLLERAGREVMYSAPIANGFTWHASVDDRWRVGGQGLGWLRETGGGEHAVWERRALLAIWGGRPAEEKRGDGREDETRRDGATGTSTTQRPRRRRTMAVTVTVTTPHRTTAYAESTATREQSTFYTSTVQHRTPERGNGYTCTVTVAKSDQFQTIQYVYSAEKHCASVNSGTARNNFAYGTENIETREKEREVLHYSRRRPDRT